MDEKISDLMTVVLQFLTLEAYQAAMTENSSVNDWPSILVDVKVPPLFERNMAGLSKDTGIPQGVLESYVISNMTACNVDELAEHCSKMIEIIKDILPDWIKVEEVGEFIKITLKGEKVDVE
jgi:hypothetical protein